MGAIFEEEDENWREREESLEFAVLEAALVVERANKVIICIRKEGVEGWRGGGVYVCSDVLEETATDEWSWACCRLRKGIAIGD